MKISKLWQKLALSFVAVTLVAVLVVYLLVNFSFERRFQSYVSERQHLLYERISESLGFAYLQSGGWTPQMTRLLPHWAIMNGVKIKVVDADGEEVAETSDVMMRMMGPEGEGSNPEAVPIVAGGQRVGTVYISILGQEGVPVEDIRFRQSINRLLILGGLLAVSVALILAYFISIRLSKPLEVITSAARNMEAGDLSQRVEIESRDEIGKLAEAFNHLAQSLKKQEKLRKDLTADIAHELRTPLATIQSHIEAYLDGVLSPDPQNLQSMHEEILRLTRLVNDLGELARVEGGKAEIVKKPVNLNEIVAKITSNLRPLFEEKKILLEVNTGSLPIVSIVDPDKISQVILNLLFNALKFTGEGGQTWVETRKENSQGWILIRDTGVGISSKDLPFVFERFYRADKSRSRTTGGSGIGLTVAKELVEAQGGEIKVESKLGKGSTFIVLLPLAS